MSPRNRLAGHEKIQIGSFVASLEGDRKPDLNPFPSSSDGFRGNCPRDHCCLDRHGLCVPFVQEIQYD